MLILGYATSSKLCRRSSSSSSILSTEFLHQGLPLANALNGSWMEQVDDLQPLRRRICKMEVKSDSVTILVNKCRISTTVLHLCLSSVIPTHLLSTPFVRRILLTFFVLSCIHQFLLWYLEGWPLFTGCAFRSGSNIRSHC